MNILEQIAVKKMPYRFAYEPQRLSMSAREVAALPAIFSELVALSLSAVVPVEKVGRVLVFEITPHRKNGYPFLFCKALDLSEYFDLWSSAIRRNEDSDVLLRCYDAMIRGLKIGNLEADEAAFLIVELLKFKNEYIRRM